MPLFFLKRKPKPKKPEYFISLDIGTEVLKGLLFTSSPLGVNVWYSYHVQQQTKAMRSGTILNPEIVRENAELVIYKLFEKINPELRPKTMVLGLAGELVNGISITVDYDRGQRASTPIDEDEERYIIKSVFSQIIEQGKQELANRLNTTVENVAVLHISITGFKVDNRNTNALIGETGTNVRLFMYASFAPLDQIKTLYSIASQLGLSIGAIVVQPFAVAKAFAGSSEPNFSGIFIDIGGGTTDVALVQNGNQIQTQMYAFGGRAFTNRIAKEFNLPYNLAEQRKLKYSAGELPLSVRDQLRNVIIPDVKLWIDSLKIALEQMEEVEEFPPIFYLCGGGAMLPDIKEQMLLYPWHKHLPFPKAPKVTIVTPERLDKVYDKSGTLVSPYDVTPASLARFLWDTKYNPKMHLVVSPVTE